MGMTADNRAEPGRSRVQVKSVDVVDNEERESPHLEGCGFGQISGPIFPVHVSPDRKNRGNRPQSGENLQCAHIPRMNDQFDTLESFSRLGSNQAVGIGYDPYEVRSSSFGFSGMQKDSFHPNVWGRTGGSPLQRDKHQAGPWADLALLFFRTRSISLEAFIPRVRRENQTRRLRSMTKYR